MLQKLCFREIRDSLGRFFAIAAIIALGVGLFAGLRVSKQAMVVTGNQYLQDLQLYDFRLLSTLGFTDEDVEALGALDGVSAVSGSVFQDVLIDNGNGSDIVMAMHTVSSDINKLDLRAGRMPETARECLVDANYFSADELGTEIVLSSGNDPDTLEQFSFRTYTIVGLADSPLYINFERGSTTLGNGSVACFGYLLPDGFQTDYYTELYLKLTQSPSIYTTSYDQLIDAMRPAVEEQLSVRASIRYDTLWSDGRQELDDACAELAQAKLDYADGKQEAEERLADAQAELEDARTDLDDGWVQLADAKQELADETAKAQREIDDAQQELEDALAELQDGEQEYLDAGQKLEDGEQDYADGVETYRDGLAEYEDATIRYETGLTKYEEGQKEYEDGLSAYRRGRSQYRDGLAQYESGLAQYQEARAKADEAAPDMAMLKQYLEANRETVEDARAAVQPVLDGLLSILQNPETGEPFPDAASLAAAISADQGLAAEAAQALAVIAPEFSISDLLAVYEMIATYDGYLAACQAYESGLAELDATQQLLEQSKAELDRASGKLSSARRQLNEAAEELEDAKAELEDAKQQLESGWLELEDGRIELEDARSELDDGWAEYHQARQELDDGWAEYRDGTEKLADAKQTLNTETAKASSEIADARQELEDGEQSYQDGLKDYADAKQTASAELEDAAQKIRDGEAEIQDGEKDLAELEPADFYTLGRDTNVGYVCFESDTDIVAGVAKIFPLFFFLVAALVCITTMTRMVDDERTKIGVLKALGYANSAIMAKYLSYAGLASILGCVAGFLAGSWVFPVVMWKVYDIMYSFSYPIQFVLDWKLAAFSIGLYLFCALGSTWFVCRSSLQEVAAELIRPKAPKSGKRIFLEYVTPLWNRMKFLHKVSARNVFRYKKRLFMMILGIGGCTALLLTGFGIRDSISNVVDFQYEEISHYDSAVTFQNPMSQADQQEFLDTCGNWIKNAVFFHGSTVDISYGKVTKSVNLVVSDDKMTEFLAFHQGDAPLPYPGDHQVLLNNGLADALGIDVGDTVTLRDSEMHTMTLTVSGVFDNYIYNYAFITPATAEAQWGFSPDIKSAYLQDLDGVDAHAAGAEVLKHPSVGAVSINEDLQARVGAMLNSLDYIVLLVIVCAGSLAFIVLYNLTSINITERIREIATIKVLGFYPMETGAYVFRENTILSVIGALAGILMGKLLHAYVMTQIKIDLMHFDIRIAGLSYAFAFCLTLVFAAVVNFVMFFKLEKINMAESLKSIE